MDHSQETPLQQLPVSLKDQSSQPQRGSTLLPAPTPNLDQEFAHWLDKFSLEALVEIKISRFFDQLDSHYPDELYTLIIEKVEKTLLHQILRRKGYNQAQASKVLGINRNTLRKKMKQYGLG